MLNSLSIVGLRSLNAQFSFSPSVNIVYGKNGAGKSTVLEAIHMLSFGRSFRTSKPDIMISHQSDRFIVRAEIEKNGLLYLVAVERQKGTTLAKINGNKASLSSISQLLPSIFVDTNTYRDFFERSATRRRFIDWMAFHVKPTHMQLVRRYNAALKSRNAALKSNIDTSPWDSILCEVACEITENRVDMVSALNTLLIENQHVFLNGLSLSYDPGYNSEAGLIDCLGATRHIDRMSGRTSVGPHKADISIGLGSIAVSDMLSQGQLKSLYHQFVRSYKTFLEGHNKPPLVLIDDYQAELDSCNRQALSMIVSGGQSIVTCIELDEAIKGEVFHVER